MGEIRLVFVSVNVDKTVPQSVPVIVVLSAKHWSEWQDLNLRPPRPERVPPQENSTFSVKYGYVRGRSFTFGCGISVGKLSDDG